MAQSPALVHGTDDEGWRDRVVRARAYGAKFCDDTAPFDEVVISPDSDGDHVILADGRRHKAAGTVMSRELRFRITVPMSRELWAGCVPGTQRPDGGGWLSRRERRQLLKGVRLQADETILIYLAGPIAEEHHCAIALGYEPFFSWSDSWCEEEAVGARDTDVQRAFRIAREELCRGERHACRYMTAAVERVEARLSSDERYWRAISAVADRLLEQHRLDRDDAVEVMRRAWEARCFDPPRQAAGAGNSG